MSKRSPSRRHVKPPRDGDTEPHGERVVCPAGAYRSVRVFDPSAATWLRWRRGLEILAEMAAEEQEQREHQAAATPKGHPAQEREP